MQIVLPSGTFGPLIEIFCSVVAIYELEVLLRSYGHIVIIV